MSWGCNAVTPLLSGGKLTLQAQKFVEASRFLSKSLAHRVDSVLAPYIKSAGAGSWVDLLKARDAARGITVSYPYSESNLQCLVRAITQSLGLSGIDIAAGFPPELQSLLKSISDIDLQLLQGGKLSDDEAISGINLIVSACAYIQDETLTEHITSIINDSSQAPVQKSTALDSEDDAATGTNVENEQPANSTNPETHESTNLMNLPEEFPLNLMRDFTIHASAFTKISYPLAHNRLNVFNEIELEHLGIARGPIRLHVDISMGNILFGMFVSAPFELADQESRRFSSHEIDLILNPVELLNVEQRSKAQLRIRAEWNSTVIAEFKHTVEILPPTLWETAPEGNLSELSFLSLAAYVMPHHPAISELLQEASAILEKQTGSPALEGYQSGPERAELIAQAIFQAFKNQEIVYIDPPASWGQGGQFIRTPEEVLNGRFGTCLDTTVVMAAAFEQAGLHPLICVIHGHAFLGYGRMEFPSSRPLFRNPLEFAQLVTGRNAIGLIETTKVTKGNNSTWEEVTSEPMKLRVRPDLSNFLAAVNVLGARQTHKIFPLPARVINSASGQENIILFNPTYVGGTPVDWQGKAKDLEGPQRGDEPARVTAWKNALLDLSLGNALIKMRPNRTVELAIPNETTGIFEDMINAGKAITLLEADKVDEQSRKQGVKTGFDYQGDLLTAILNEQFMAYTNQPGGRYDTVLRRLQLQAKNYRQETGANNLYLSFGTLKWTFMGSELQSPLILVPVRLELIAKNSQYRLVLDDAGESTPNFCLLEKLSKELQFEIPGLRNPKMDDSGIDLPAAFSAVREAILEAGLDFQVEHSVHLGILQFAKFRLWKDLDDNWHNLIKNPLVNHLVESSNEPFIDPVAPPLDQDLEDLIVGLPIPADAAQLKAVQEAVAGRTFVLEGPPGTGKSQAITNILSRAITEGKKVLFVAEKAEALNVVKKRLDSVGLGALALDAHDKGAKPDVIKAQLKAALDLAAEFDEASLDSAYQAVQTSRTALIRYRDRMTSTNGAGYSLYGARQVALNPEKRVEPINIGTSFVARCSRADIETVRRALEEAVVFGASARPAKEHPWRFIDFPLDEQTIADSLEVIQVLESSVSSLNSQPVLSGLLGQIKNSEDANTASEILTRPGISLTTIDAALSQAWAESAAAFVKRSTDFAAIPQIALLTFKAEVLELDLPALHTTALGADSLGFGAKKQMRSSITDLLSPFTLPGKKLNPRKAVSYTAPLLALRESVNALISESNSIPGLNVPSDWNPFLPSARSRLIELIEWLKSTAVSLQPSSDNDGDPLKNELRALLSSASTLEENVIEQFRLFAQSITELGEVAHINSQSLSNWSSQGGFCATWVRTREQRGTAALEQKQTLTTWISFVRALQPVKDLGLGETVSELLNGVIRIDDANEAFNNGLALASVDERLEGTGLRDFDAETHERQVDRYRVGMSRVRELLPAALPRTIMAKRPFNASANSGRIGVLRQQLEKKRGGLTVRGIFNEFSDIITAVTPCVMMSPESVARLFPATPDLFDLVVFDEASQLRVADSVGAMGRGKSVVVVGDSKQMPPTSFFDQAGDSASDDAAEEKESLEDLIDIFEDQESILSECTQAVVPRHLLSWHYRSQDESLISFSNDKYYDSKLASFPSPLFGKRDDGFAGHGISLRRVKVPATKITGKLINEVEADAVVAEVEARFKASPDEAPSIGIITFNKAYASAIDKKLRALLNDRISAALEDDDGIFVKSIEFVQGDERDTILFAVGKTADPAKNEVALSGFGPLGQGGGERRWNVAITRARRQIVMFCSFDPEQLDATRATNDGVKHLREYLDKAKAGSDTAMADTYRKRVIDLHRDQIAERLRSKGYEVTTDVGLSDFRVDIAVSKPGKASDSAVAVLLDSPRWSNRETVVDRDALPGDVLEKLMRWPSVQRIWMPEWLTNPDEVISRITSAVEGKSPAPTSAHSVKLTADELIETGQITPLNSDGSVPDGVPPLEAKPFPMAGINDSASFAVDELEGETEFIECSIRVVAGREYLDALPHHPGAVEGVQNVMNQIVDIESPIHLSRLAKLVAACFDLNKVNQARIDSILQVVPKSIKVPEDEEFAWASGTNPESWRGFRRTPEGTSRPIDVISWREITNAMVSLTSNNLGMNVDELKKETALLFGTKRITENISKYLDDVITKGVRNGKLILSDTGVIIPA